MDPDEIQGVINGISEAVSGSTANLKAINWIPVGQYKIDRLMAEIANLQSSLLLVSGRLQIGMNQQ